jgi:pyruvate/2-oxoglutarate dehydrogenase complex dihydrolipoamide acyltransferase (E2) component
MSKTHTALATQDATAAPYRRVEVPPARRNTPEYLDLYWWKHSIYALLEVDVTEARRLLAAHHDSTGEAISFTGFLTYSLARAVAQDPSVQAYRQGRRHLAIFEDVDVFLPVEREALGTAVAVPHIIRAANRKNLLDIHREIRAVQTAPVPPGGGFPKAFQLLMSTPAPLPRLFVRLMRAAGRRNPSRRVNAAGTVGVTALGMAGHRGGWGVAPAGQSLLLVVGGIALKPAVVDGRIEPREILDLTLAFDHDVVDGAPAARFTRRLVDLIEGAHGLHDLRGSDGRVP